MIITIKNDESGKPCVVFEKGNGHESIIRSKGKSIIDFPSSFVVIDLETTGFDPFYEEIIEMSAIRIAEGKTVSVFSELVKPRYPVNSYITELTGITNVMLIN